MIRAWLVLILLSCFVIWVIVVTFKNRKKKTTLFLPRFVARSASAEIWAQLYETNSFDEMNVIRLRLSEEGIEHMVFEQGKRDLQGNAPKKFGIVTTRGHLSRGQSILAKLLT